MAKSTGIAMFLSKGQADPYGGVITSADIHLSVFTKLLRVEVSSLSYNIENVGFY